jgi:hypothetical protein
MRSRALAASSLLLAAAALAHAAAVVPETRKAQLGRCVPGGDRCTIQGTCSGGRVCDLRKIDTFTAQVAIEINDQACPPDAPGAVVAVTVYGERPRNRGTFSTPRRTVSYCGKDVRCSAPGSDGAFLCAFDDVVTLSEDTRLSTAWLELSTFPSAVQTALRTVLGQGTPIIGSGKVRLVGEDRHANDEAPTRLRYCIKGYLLQP